MGDSDRNKEEQYSNILSDFVACTGIQDEGQAIRYLENVNWDLLAAINLVMPQHSQRLPSEAASSSGDVEMITISSDIPGTSPVTTYTNPNASIITIAPEDEDEDMPSSSSSNHRKPKTIQFKILYNKSTISIPMSENKTVYDLKLEVFSRTGLQICKQFFKGWPHNEFIFNDKVTLSSLKLPTVTDLILDSKASPMPQNGHSSSSYNNMKKKKCDASDASKLYKLNIADLTNGREYHLKYGGNTKVSAVKEDVAALSKIPISQQVWTGWSDQEESGGDSEDEEVVEVKTRGRARSKEERDSMSLYKTGIGYPNHDLTVEGVVESNPAVSNPASNKVIDVPDTDSSMDEYEDAACFTEEEEDTVSEVLSTRRTLQSLIPDNIEDETTGTIHLIEQFESRYGDQRPHFYPGTLDDAIREACFKPAAQRKILAVYLHHDSSVLSNVFCSQLLCFESVLEFLATSCVVWGWDLTYKSNQAKFLSSVSSSLGSVATMTLRSHMDIDRLPALVLITRMRATTEIFTVINGNVGAQEVFGEQQRTEIREEEERNQREMIKIEQDEAYQQSLAVDRAKEESKRLAERQELEAKTRLESEIQAAAQKKEAHKKHLASILPPEPPQPSSSTPGIITVRFRCPAPASTHTGGGGEGGVGSANSSAGGATKCRRFYATQPVQDLINYLIVEGYDAEDYKVIFGWPRKELSPDISHQTLAELKFCPQETLIVEER
ncbi:hypothetical protein M8J75_014753 [Diaphorina citri]|nr:hypothetical protein M8J75_014753 [Diaphorina citri]